MLSFNYLQLHNFLDFIFNYAKVEKKPGNHVRIARLFNGRYSGVGCGRSVHGFAAIAQSADVLVDFTHDVQSHPLADCAAFGTYEQTVFNQTAKLRAFLVYNTNDLIFKKKVRIGGIFHIRGDSDVFHTVTIIG